MARVTATGWRLQDTLAEMNPTPPATALDGAFRALIRSEREKVILPSLDHGLFDYPMLVFPNI